MLRLQSMSTGSKSLALALLVGLSPPAIFVPTASLALPLLQTSAETIAQDSLTGQVIDQDSDSAVGTVGTIIQSSSTEGTGNVGGSTGGNSTATAEFGRLALGATAMFDANGSAENQEFATFASASASMKDTFTIVTGGTGFQSGFFSVVLRLSGDQSASLSSPGFGRTGSLYRLDAKIANDCSGPITAGCAEFTGAVDDIAGTMFSSGDVLGSTGLAFLIQDIPIIFNQATSLTIELGVMSVAQSGFDTENGIAVTDLTHTLLWGGFASVLDALGDPITNFTVTSESGFDWSKPFSVSPPIGIAEPGLLPLVAVSLAWLLGVAGVFGTRRRISRSFET